MSQDKWSEVDAYFVDKLVPADEALDFALAESKRAGVPDHAVAPNQGKLLYLLARMMNAKRILEIGTLGAYSTIWLARAVGEGGHVLTLEANSAHVALAQRNIQHAGLEAVVQIATGKAVETLARLIEAREAPFDFIFIDADKPSNPDYLALSLKLARRGTVIVGDNVVREGEVANPLSTASSVIGVRQFFDLMAVMPGLSATAIQTVGSKGYDGFSIALVE